MIDRERDIRGQALIKSIWEGFSHGMADEPTFVMERVETYFKFSAKLIESYAKLDTNQPLQNSPQVHLSDEKVADGLRPPYDPNVVPKDSQMPNKERQFVFASEKQCNRAWAIACSNGWIINKQPLPQFRSLCQRFGFQNSKKIPVEVYNSFIKALEMGCQPQESSAHLQ